MDKRLVITVDNGISALEPGRAKRSWLRPCRGHARLLSAVGEVWRPRRGGRVTLKPEHISDFREALEAYARTVEVGREVIKPETHLDLREYTPEFEQLIRRFEPFGIGNPAPVFRIRNALLGKAKAYVSTLTQGKQTVRVRHGDDVQLNFTQVERDYVVEATTRGLVLQGWPSNGRLPLADIEGRFDGLV